MPDPGALLEPVGEPDERRLAPAPPDEVDPDRQLPEGEPGRDGDVRVAGDRRRGRAGGQEVVAVDQVGRPRRAVGEADDRVQVEPVQGPVDALLRQPLGGRQGLQVGGVVQAGGRLGEQEDLLAEPAQLLLGVGVVEGDQVGQGAHRGALQLRQVGGDVGLELEQQHGELGPEHVGDVGDVGRVDDGRAEAAQLADGGVGDRVGLGADPEHALPPHADAGAAQAVGVQEAAVVAEGVAAAVGGGRVAWVDPGHRAEDGGGVGHGPGHRAGHVLAVGQRDDAGAAGQAEGRLDADQGVVGGGADDRAVGLGAERGGGQAGGDRGAGP